MPFFENMFDCCEWILFHPNSIWSDTNEKWNEASSEWRTVGMTPNKFMPKSLEEKETQYVKSFSSMDLFTVFPKKYYCIVEFQSGRLEVGYCLGISETNTYIILEADRGEDCGKVIGNIGEHEFESLCLKVRDTGNEIEPKKVLRQASPSEVNKLRQRKETEVWSLRQCRELVGHKGLNMEILSCEYQWDMKKITFYFKSDRRIDFRELLKDLFKLFKTRIWMCAERRTNNNIIKKILE